MIFVCLMYSMCAMPLKQFILNYVSTVHKKYPFVPHFWLYSILFSILLNIYSIFYFPQHLFFFLFSSTFILFSIFLNSYSFFYFPQHFFFFYFPKQLFFFLFSSTFIIFLFFPQHLYFFLFSSTFIHFSSFLNIYLYQPQKCIPLLKNCLRSNTQLLKWKISSSSCFIVLQFKFS